MRAPPGPMSRRPPAPPTAAPAPRVRHGADVGAEPAPGRAANASAPPPTAKPHTRARGGAVASAPPRPSSADRGERDLELVADRRRSARRAAGSGPSSERRDQVRAEREVDHDAAPTVTAAGSDERPRPRQEAVRRRARAPRTPPPRSASRRAADGASAPVSEQHAGSHSAASSAQRPAAARRGAPTPHEPASSSERADQAEPDHAPSGAGRASVRRLRSSTRSAGARRRRAPRSARPTCRRAPPTPSRSSTVGAMSVELTRPSVRVESECSVVPAGEPGRARRPAAAA